MANKASKFETFYFTVDDWARAYRFEVNRHKWELSPNHYSERDEILVAGRLSSYTKRKIIHGQAHILPSFIGRDDREKIAADQIGNAWVKKGRRRSVSTRRVIQRCEIAQEMDQI